MALKNLIATEMNRYFPRLWLSLRVARRDKHFDPEFWFIPLLCDEHRVAVDIGTNMGEYTYFMSRYAKTVLAFEPNSDLWPEILRRAPHAKIEGVALSDHDGSAEFRYVSTNTGIATIEVNNRLGMISDSSSIQSRTVPLQTLDSYNLVEVSFIKIDVEGHEEAVLKGARQTLARCRPALLIETEDRHNPGAPIRVFSLLREAGYDGFAICGAEFMSLNTPLPPTDERYTNNFLFLPKEHNDLRVRMFNFAKSITETLARRVQPAFTSVKGMDQ